MEYLISHFGPHEYEAYRAFRVRFGESTTEMGDDFRRKWWCFDNPLGGMLAFAHTDSEVVATCYLSGKKLVLANGMELPAYEIGETWTHESHRRKGLFGKLVKYCEKYAFEDGAKIVYGTPNSQSTPGYSKLNYEIVNTETSCLNFVANILWFIKRDADVLKPLSEGASLQNALKKSPYEISGDKYAQGTVTMFRICGATTDRIRWRFQESSLSYRYYKLTLREKSFYCAIRFGVLGKYPILVVSEYFLNGSRCSLRDAVPFLKKITNSAYKFNSFAGFYFHAEKIEGAKKLSALLTFTMPHRVLPFCVKINGAQDLEDFINQLPGFQLSDCDIG